jgi:hypothetical protein
MRRSNMNCLTFRPDVWSLPMERPTRFELTINQKTAATLRSKFRSAILARADAVVE